MIEKENEMLWRKQTPMQMDGNYCPVCGTMQFIADIGYCKTCGQAQKHSDESLHPAGPPPFNKGGEGDEEETEVDILSDINDRS